MKRELTLNDIAGYATERMVWQMLLSLSEHFKAGHYAPVSPLDIILEGNKFGVKSPKASTEQEARSFSAPESFHRGSEEASEASCVWTLGALAFYLIMGISVFEGKGGETQEEDTEVPRISSVHASPSLGAMIGQCLSFLPSSRPSLEEIRHQAQAALRVEAVPRKRLLMQSGKSYKDSLVKFWPEEMMPFLLVCLFLLAPMRLMAQKFTVPQEMASLVFRCVDLRSPSNAGKVGKALERDISWTMMDELAIDSLGECSTKQSVDMFGLNDLGFSILKRRRGVTNAGGRFRDGRDPRFKYSFIEVTVRSQAEVNYVISGREGEQIFAIVPFDKNAVFEASVSHQSEYSSFVKDGVCYIQLKKKFVKTDRFTLTIRNKSGNNGAFAIINYNSHQL